MPFILGEKNKSIIFFIATDRLHYFAKVSCKHFKTIFDNVYRMNMNYEHSSISSKNISPFGQSIAEIFTIFFVELLSGHPILLMLIYKFQDVVACLDKFRAHEHFDSCLKEKKNRLL